MTDSENAPQEQDSTDGDRPEQASPTGTPTIPVTPVQEYRRDSVVRRVAWNDILPWTRLFQALPMSLGASVLLLAMIASWLTPVGWQMGASLFLDSKIDTVNLRVVRPILEDWPATELEKSSMLEPGPLPGLRHLGERIALPRRIVSGATSHSIEAWAYLTFGLLWSMAIWSVFGGAIARMAVLRVGRNSRCGPIEGLKYCVRRCLSFWGAPLLPLAGVGGGAICLMLLGAIMRVDALATVVAFGWLFVLLGGILMSLLLMGVTLGWPIMWCAVVAAKDGDAFDALSRSFAYVYQKFLRLLA